MSQIIKNIRTFCIVLPECPERTEKARAHFKERGVECQWFDGVHAERFGLKTEHTYERDHPGTNFKICAKVIGICLSHYVLWNVMKYLFDDHFMVLESDALFPEDWHARLTQALVDVPADFDMLYPGSCCTKGHPRRGPFKMGSRVSVLGDGEEQPQTPDARPQTPGVWEVRWPQCTHCYIVARKAIPTLLETQRKVYGPIDCQMADLSFPKLKGGVYTVLPRIVGQFDTEIAE